MTEFISLDEFLNLPELSYKPDRSYYCNRTGRDWSIWYKQAKQSYDKYGDEGPPIGALVRTLVAGHGGGAGVVRKFGGIYEADPRFFYIIEQKEKDVNFQKSLLERAYWWRSIYVVDNSKTKSIFKDL